MSQRIRIYLFSVCTLAFLMWPLTTAVGQVTTPDSTKIDTSRGLYAGYQTWKEYLAHQDSLPSQHHDVELAWATLGIGGSSAVPYGIYDWVVAGLLTYERDNVLYSLRYLDQRDYNFGSNPERMYEIDALVGLGAYSRFVLLNGSIGLGFRHHFHYLTDPYQSQSIPAAETLNSLAIPAQLNLIIPFLNSFAIGLSAFGTYTREGFDHGFALTWSFGKLIENSEWPGIP